MSLEDLRGRCPVPFFSPDNFDDSEGFLEGRMCGDYPIFGECCLPCPMTDWVYPDYFDTFTQVVNWICVAGTVCCVFLLLSWAILPVEKTNRHYLSICLTSAVLLMNLGFVIPLAAQPDECANAITPHDMHSSPVCGASGAFLLFGGFAGVMWAFLRALSLHLQICWQVVVGRSFMFFSHASGWGIPIVIIICAMVFSGVSFRLGATCHINHDNSMATFWVPILVFAAVTVVVQFATFGYCIKVYLASLSDNSASTEGSSLPAYSASVRTMTPRQAYRRVRRVIALQWRGIAIVLIIIADVIFFSVMFVFQDLTVHNVGTDAAKAAQAAADGGDVMAPSGNSAQDWIICLYAAKGDKNQCLDKAKDLVTNEGTIIAVLILLAINGIWLVLLLGRWSMVTGWIDLFKSFGNTRKKEFVSVDARYDIKQDTRAYEMLSKDSSAVVTPIDPVKTPMSGGGDGRRTPDFFGQTARYHAPARSFSSPRVPQSPPSSPPPGWDVRATYARPGQDNDANNWDNMNPLGMNRI